MKGVIKSLEEQPVVAIRVQTKMTELAKVLTSVYTSVSTYIKDKGLTTRGTPFVQYFAMNWEEFSKKSLLLYTLKNFNAVYDICAGIPVDRLTESADGIESFSFPSGRYLEFEHIGSYMKLGKTYKAYIADALKNDLALKPETTEYYLNAPGDVPTRELKTLIQVPLIS